jgi:predicted amidohydrolase YtcJ
VANVQTFWAQYDEGIAALLSPLVGEERFGRLYPFGSIRRNGAVMAVGSDWPVSTPNPLAELEVAVTRTPLESRDAEPFLPEERLDLATALSAFTRGSAYVNRDDDAGSLEPGRRADLAVLDRNIFDRSRGPIGEARVETTLAGGRVVHGG